MTAALPDWNNAIQREQGKTEFSIKSIVIPLDDNQPSRTALPVAHTLAELYRCVLHIMYVGKEQLDMKHAASQLGLAAEQARGAIFEQRSGTPEDAVTPLGDNSEGLLVMSTTVGSQKADNRFGFLTESFLAAKPQRAVLVNADVGDKRWSFRRILLAHDGTPISNPAVAVAADLAQRSGAEVIALHVAARGEERPEARGSIAAPLYVDQAHHEWPAWAEEFMNRVVASGALGSAGHFKLKVTGGEAGSELVGVAHESKVDLVIMAWHGHWTEHEDCATRVVIRNAGCPVMLVYSVSGGA
jgi:nucleotide-binding universal stress UspA family protein